MNQKRPKPFIFHFFRREAAQSDRVTWRLIQEDTDIIVDIIDVKVPCTTYVRDIGPRAVMKGIGNIRFEYYKEDGYKKIKAIIE